MQVNVLYKIKRGNSDSQAGVIIKGANASVLAHGSQSPPKSTEDLVLIEEEFLTTGMHPFYLLPDYIYFTGSADDIELIGRGYEETENNI